MNLSMWNLGKIINWPYIIDRIFLAGSVVIKNKKELKNTKV